MKLAAHAKTRFLSLISVLVLSSLAMPGCRWHEDEYKKYVGDRGNLETCKGICTKDANLSKEDCTGDGLQWIKASCVINGSVDTNVVKKSDCSGVWNDGKCKYTAKEKCPEDSWAEFKLYETGKGQYVWVNDNKYYCGSYDEISNGNVKECEGIDEYIKDMNYGLCNTSTFCRSLKLKEEVVAACTSCPNGNVMCGDECVDVMYNSKHCGLCGNSCDENNGEFCDSGICTTSCKDIEDDNGVITIHKKICSLNEQTVCADIDNDPKNCGDCGHDCRDDDPEVGTWMCKSGGCVPVDTCGKNQIQCYCSYDDTGNIIACNEEKNEGSDELLCINKLAIDTCGAQSCQNRGFVCPIGQKCVENINSYECQCGDGLVKVDDVCLNPYDPRTCGVTIDTVNNDNSCKNNEICNGTSCVCAQGYEKCDGVEGCVDILNNPNHCGNCDTDCGNNAYCENGVCLCNNGFSRCKASGGHVYCGEEIENCIESKYPEHCGAKGLAIDPMPDSPNFIGYVCDSEADCLKKEDSWQCGCESFICDNRCINSLKDLNYCGSTSCDNGINCFVEGENTKCNNGICECTGENLLFVGVQEIEGKISYTTDLNNEKIVRYDCVNTKSDPLCCGGKNNCVNKQCDSGKVCTQGYCENSCSDGEVSCNGNCLDKKYYHVEKMEDGHCECTINEFNKLMCPTKGNVDYGCLVEKGDKNNCGECGKKCDLTYSCIDNGCRCGYGEEECVYSVSLYDDNKSEVKRCMNFEELHMTDCITCVKGWGNLDKDWSNGCEADLKENLHYCGTETNDCTMVCSEDDNDCTPSVVNAGGIVCRNGQCGYSTCNHGDYMDCDKEKLDAPYYFLDENNNDSILGCETNIKTNKDHCGTCGFVCESGNCENGKCCYSNNKNIHSDLSRFECCSNNELYQYDHNWWKGCYDSSHYGCSESELKGDGNLGMNCWSKVNTVD